MDKDTRRELIEEIEDKRWEFTSEYGAFNAELIADLIIERERKLEERVKELQKYERIVGAEPKYYASLYEANCKWMELESTIAEMNKIFWQCGQDIDLFAMQIKTKESTYKDGYCDRMFKASQFLGVAIDSALRIAKGTASE